MNPIFLNLSHGIVALVPSDAGTFIGGIRMISDITSDEVGLLAKSMHLKLATFGLPFSGAKAGILSQSMNKEALKKFLLEIAPLLRGCSREELKDMVIESERAILPEKIHFITGPDIGTSEDLYIEAMHEIGLSDIARKGFLSEIHPTYNLPMDNLTTGLGVVVTAEEIFRSKGIFLKSEDPLSGKTFALEGFGKVATGIAKLLQGRANLIAVSTVHGTIVHNPSTKCCTKHGFDVEKLLALKSEHGDNFINYTDHDVLDRESLFLQHVDFLVPGARTEVITEELAMKIASMNTTSVIVPAANYPYTKKGLEVLEAKGVFCAPDFISSAGAVIAAMEEFTSWETMNKFERSLDLVANSIRYEIRDLIIEGIACGCSAVVGATGKKAQSLYELAIERAKSREKITMGNNMQEIADAVLGYYL